MRIATRTNLIGVACVAAVTILALGAHFWMVREPSFPNDRERIQWEIARFGPAAAYEKVANEASTRPFQEQHGFGHTVGSALYESEGLKGLAVCDIRMFSGCFHQIVSDAIRDHGLAVIPELYAVCSGGEKSRTVACEHGMGHGIVGYFGPLPSDLEKALEECEKLPGINHTQGCDGGAIMEHVDHTMQAAENQPGEKEKGKGVCESVSARFRPDCFYWSPHWWRENLEHEGVTSAMYAELGKLCARRTATVQERASCYAGIGYIASPDSGFDSEKSAKLCADAAITDKDQTECLEAAASSQGT